MLESDNNLTEIAYAKVNLALHVRRRRDDGYHELETLFAFADQGDILSAEPAPDLSLTITGPFAAGLTVDDDNLVMRAARAVQTNGQGARMHLQKNLPIASGIGGGSADAAAALRLLQRLWGSNHDMLSIARTLGADVPACLFSETLYGEGIGDDLRPWESDGIVGCPILLINPGVSCPTGPIFAAWDGVDRGALNPAQWANGRNDLQIPATLIVPEIALVLDALKAQAGQSVVRMSGSGATCFALFADIAHRDAAQAALQKRHPHWWTMAALLR